MKKIICCLLVISMLFAMSTTAFAGEIKVENEKGTLLIVQLTEKSILVSEGDVSSLIKVEETAQKTTVTVKNLETSESNFFVRDYERNTLYSSITDYEGILAASTRSNIGWHRISYNEASRYLSEAASAADIVGYVTSMAGCQGISTLAQAVSLILNVISYGLSLKDPNTGIKYRVGIVTITKHQAGGVITVDVERVVEVGTY